MHTQSFDEARRLADEATGPLAHFIRRHLQVMVEQGYVGRTVYERTHRAIDFDRWPETANIPLAAVDERCVTLYHQHRSGPRLRRWQNELRFLRMLLVYLRANGAIPSLPVVSAYPAIDKTIDGFAHHLRHHRGLAAGTIAQYGNYARDFLAERFGAAQVCLAEITATDVIEQIRRQAAHSSPAMLKTVVTALRSFLRYSLYVGETEPGLIAAVPAIARWATTPPMPGAIAPAHARQVIAHFSGTSPRALRDRAILLLLARLGLRSGDIVYVSGVQLNHKTRSGCSTSRRLSPGSAAFCYLRRRFPDARPI